MNDAARAIRLLMNLRRNGVTDTNVLSVIERIPREYFVPQNFNDKAYEDTALPIGHGQTISQPLVVAMMTQELELNPRHTVLEIGTGSGYQAAILSQLCRRLYSIERLKPLHDIAVARFEEMKIRNVTAVVGDGYKGMPNAAPFDRIILTCGASQEPPPALLEQLAPNGIMILPVRLNALKEQLVKIRKDEEGAITQQPIMDVRFVPLVSEHDVFAAS
jgi:protein-L-isoaspartate(D-aspartate) O-methyltransferase